METKKFSTILELFSDKVVDPGLTLLFVLSIFCFLYGLLQFYINSDSPDARGKYVYVLVYSVIGFAFLFGLKSILSLITF